MTKKSPTPLCPDPKDFDTAYRKAIEGGIEDLPSNLSELAALLYQNDDFEVNLTALKELIATYRDLAAETLRVRLNDRRSSFLKAVNHRPEPSRPDGEKTGGRKRTKRQREEA